MFFFTVYTDYNDLWNEKGVDVHRMLIVVEVFEEQEPRC